MPMSHTTHNTRQAGKTFASSAQTLQMKSTGGAGMQHTDNRPGMVAQRKLNDAMSNAVCAPAATGEGTVQLYSYGRGSTQQIKVIGKNDSNTFEECYYNSVTYKKGEQKRYGSETQNPAAWAGWLQNQKNGRNATQLHVVNARWGGEGGRDDGNIVPGTPAENSHHLHQAEKQFDKCFDGNDKAIDDCKYECTVNPDYGTTVSVKNGSVDCEDPTIRVDITTPLGTTNYPVTDGGGLRFVDGS